jgi:XTP/dITP diphosphohydrolase
MGLRYSESGRPTRARGGATKSPGAPSASPGAARLLLATGNEHKRREFARLLPGLHVDALPDGVILPPEEGSTFEENALGKARAAAAATGRASIADDSGIEAAALGGAPGVRSARYAGEGATDEQNLAKLLREAPAGSPLAYVCALAYVDPASGLERVFLGRWTGRLAERPRGNGGFGYDPAFLPDEEPGGLTAAQLSDARKDAISHRGHAARALYEWLTAG